MEEVMTENNNSQVMDKNHVLPTAAQEQKEIRIPLNKTSDITLKPMQIKLQRCDTRMCSKKCLDYLQVQGQPEPGSVHVTDTTPSIYNRSDREVCNSNGTERFTCHGCGQDVVSDTALCRHLERSMALRNNRIKMSQQKLFSGNEPSRSQKHIEPSVEHVGDTDSRCENSTSVHPENGKITSLETAIGGCRRLTGETSSVRNSYQDVLTENEDGE